MALWNNIKAHMFSCQMAFFIPNFSILNSCLYHSLNFIFLLGIRISALSWPFCKSPPLGRKEISVVAGAVIQQQQGRKGDTEDAQPSPMLPSLGTYLRERAVCSVGTLQLSLQGQACNPQTPNACVKQQHWQWLWQEIPYKIFTMTFDIKQCPYGSWLIQIHTLFTQDSE